MTEDQIIDGVFDREGRTFGDRTTHPQIDQPTAPGGITLDTLTEFRGRPCTVDDLKALTLDDCRAVIRWKIRRDLERYKFDAIAFDPLKWALFDFAYNSGEELAVRWLQRALLFPEPMVTGHIDDRTLFALTKQPPILIVNALCAERAYMIESSTKIEEQYKHGLLKRVIQFVIPRAEIAAA